MLSMSAGSRSDWSSKMTKRSSSPIWQAQPPSVVLLHLSDEFRQGLLCFKSWHRKMHEIARLICFQESDHLFHQAEGWSTITIEQRDRSSPRTVEWYGVGCRDKS